jgi:hypothetical protein
MLKEIPREDVLKLKGETHCRWFRDDYFDLFVWSNEFDFVCKKIEAYHENMG